MRDAHTHAGRPLKQSVHVGKVPKKATAEYEVVPGSGTDELAGLSGNGGFSAGHAEEHDMTLYCEV